MGSKHPPRGVLNGPSLWVLMASKGLCSDTSELLSWGGLSKQELLTSLGTKYLARQHKTCVQNHSCPLTVQAFALHLSRAQRILVLQPS